MPDHPNAFDWLLRNVGAAIGINAVAALAAHAGAGAFWLLVAVAALTVLPAALAAPRSRDIDASAQHASPARS